MTIAIILIYFFITLGIGIYAYRSSENNPDDYFLAGRTVGPVVLFFTLIATNFSAFLFLGFAGEAYRNGYSYYGFMSFGTALVALSFYYIGRPIWQAGKTHGYITPPEMIGDRLNSPALKFVFLIVMVAFTMPYLAIQPIGAGILLTEMTGGAIGEFEGAVVLSIFIVLYTYLGGMRSVALTDVVQGVIMLVLLFLAVGFIGAKLGGLAEANQRVLEIKPELFTRSGAYSPQKWFSLMILWVLAVPMFPQMFMRFFIPKNSTALRSTARAYPLVTAFLFLCPVIIGILGHLAFPGLEGKAADTILPQMLTKFAPEWLAATIMVGALAAIMSTMDSQLLAMSSMLTRDFYLSFYNRRASIESQVWVGRALVILLAVIGLGIAYLRPASIFAIATQAFTGLALLFPTTVAVLFWRKATAAGCLASILVSEGLLIALAVGWIPPGWTMGFLPVVPLFVVACLVLAAVSLLTSSDEGQNPEVL